jgi:hypothetical protein
MHKKKLWIFGDSFADPHYMVDNKPGTGTWVSGLTERYDTTNFSRCGTGPDWSINHLLDAMEQTPEHELQNISVIFLISYTLRFNLGFLDDRDQVLCSLLAGDESWQEIKTDTDYSNYCKFMFMFFEHYVVHSKYDRSEILKIIGLLKILSNQLEKILVWPVVDRASIVPNNDDRFQFVNHPLIEISGPIPYPDLRFNHLSTDKHPVMLTCLIQWMDSGLQITIDDLISFR